MRVVVPFTTVRPEVYAALDRYGFTWDRHDVSWALDAYSRLLRRLWRAGGPLVVVEHDVLVHGEVRPQFEECGFPWCTFLVPRHAYPEQPLLESLGCVRFSAECVAELPDLMEEAAEFSAGLIPGHWLHFDTAVAAAFHAHGLVAHTHGPPVEHLSRQAC